MSQVSDEAGEFYFTFFLSCLVLSLMSVICICIQHCILLCIYIHIYCIAFMCVLLVTLIDYVYIDTAIRYLPLAFPVLSIFPFVPQFVWTRLYSSITSGPMGVDIASCRRCYRGCFTWWGIGV